MTRQGTLFLSECVRDGWLLLGGKSRIEGVTMAMAQTGHEAGTGRSHLDCSGGIRRLCCEGIDLSSTLGAVNSTSGHLVGADGGRGS